MAISSYYPDWATIGGGTGNYLDFGDFSSTGVPPRGGTFNNASLFFPAGVIRDRDLSQVESLDPMRLTEEVARSWYTYSAGDDQAVQPYQGETHPNYTGPTPPYDYLDVGSRYSWLKSPRYGGAVMETGPLARMLISYADGRPQVKTLLDSTLSQLHLGTGALFSTLGRQLARGVETVVVAQQALVVLAQLRELIASGNTQTFDDTKWDPGTWPSSARGFGLHAGRGGAVALGRDQRRQGIELPGGVPDDLERRAPRRLRAARPVRGGADRHAGPRSDPAAGDSPHTALL